MNRLDRAVEAGEQEVDAWRCLAQGDEGYEFDLAVALEMLGRLLTATGRHEETHLRRSRGALAAPQPP
ncbi:hypothetical protein [Streptomyces sp. NPDC001135]